MATIVLSERLHVALTGLLAHEKAIDAAATDPSGRVSDHAETRDLFAGIQRASSGHLMAIRERLNLTSGDGFTEADQPRSNPPEFARLHPVSDLLCAIYSLLGEAVVRYSAMQSVANRMADSWAVASEGTTAHIARDHTQEYVALMGRATNILHDAVIWELEEDGLECRCSCPSCGLGVCLCAVSARGILSPAIANALPRVARSGVEVVRPRSGSSAEGAGLQQGDIVISIDSVAVTELPVLQAAIRDHEPGEIEFSVLRNGEQIVLTCETGS